MISRNIFGFSVAPHMRRVLAVNGCFASIMKADKKKEKDGMGLPTGIPIPVLPVDFLKDRPDSWVGGQGSYVVPVDSDWGLWFNFSMNNYNHMAVLASVKGMNPLTGARIDGYSLEKYTDKCPIHDEKFKHGRFCSSCNFKWPEQNYLSSPNAPYIDGFRTPEGIVRQFYFTEDLAKSIPELVIGKEDTVPAFGFCFYKLKNIQEKWEGGNRLKNTFPDGGRDVYRGGDDDDIPRDYLSSGIGGIIRSYSSKPRDKSLTPEPLTLHRDGAWTKSLLSDGGLRKKGTTKGGSDIRYSSSKREDVVRGIGFGDHVDPITDGEMTVTNMSSGFMSDTSSSSVYMCSAAAAASPTMDSLSILEEAPAETKHVKLGKRSRTAEVGVGAGAKISQEFTGDNRELTDWHKKPAGIIRLYFVFQEQFEKYASAGYNDIIGEKEGYMSGLPVGGAK